MQTPPLDPDVADIAPSDSVLTHYDEEDLINADVEGADWREVARIVLHLDPERDSDRPEGVRQPLIARQMDDGAWLPAPATWWRVGLKRRGHRRGLLDMRDLGAMLDHEEPLPHPAEDQAQ